jgi:hypothetical protein
MNYNQSSTDTLAKTTGIAKFIGNYTLCLMKTPQRVLNYAAMGKNDLQSFNRIFNFVMQNSMHIANPRYPLELSKDIYLLAHTGTKYPSSTTYKIASRDLAKLQVSEGFSDSCSTGTTGRMLNDVKCYPIDLVTQVDSNGGIMIDEVTAKPINVRSLDQTTNPVPIVVDTTSGNKNGILFWLTLALFIVVVIILGLFLYFFLKSNDTVPGAAVAAPVAAVAAPMAAVAAPMAAVAAPVAAVAAPMAAVAAPVAALALASASPPPAPPAPAPPAPALPAPAPPAPARRAPARRSPTPGADTLRKKAARNPALAAALQAQQELAEAEAEFNERQKHVHRALIQ